MAIEGDLKDLSLATLLQMLCMERRRATLQVARRGEEGLIFLADGEIVHCALGQLEGEAAVYHLLSWTEGLFRIGDYRNGCPRTVGRNLNYLLLESTRIFDEKQRAKGARGGEAGQGLSPVEEEFDRALEGALFSLAAEIEQLAAKLDLRKVRKRPLQALSVIEQILNRIAEFEEAIPGVDLSAASLVKALSRVASRYPQSRLLYVRNNRVSAQTAANLYMGWADDAADRTHMFRQVCRSAVAISEDCFSRLASYIYSPTRRELWHETYNVLVLQLTQALEALDP